MSVGDITITANSPGNLFRNLGRRSLKRGRNLTMNKIKIPGRALGIGA